MLVLGPNETILASSFWPISNQGLYPLVLLRISNRSASAAVGLNAAKAKLRVRKGVNDFFMIETGCMFLGLPGGSTIPPGDFFSEFLVKLPARAWIVKFLARVKVKHSPF